MIKYDPDLVSKIDENQLNRFYSIDQFEFLKPIEEQFDVINQEWLEACSDSNRFVKWPQPWMIASGVWDLIVLKLSEGVQHPGTEQYNQSYASLFPKTLDILMSCVGDKLDGVSFSRLAPGTHLTPHRGRFSNTLRAHLGIDIPVGDCKIKVQNEEIKWEEGKIIILDDRLVHEAWNRTDKNRIVMIFDFTVTNEQVPGFFPE